MAKRVKEMHSYVCSDLAKEFQRFDEKPEKYFKSYEGIRVSKYELVRVSTYGRSLNSVYY